MKNTLNRLGKSLDYYLTKLGLGLRAKLIIIFLLVKVIPLILIAVIAWQQFTILGDVLQNIAVTDSSEALNASAVENIERLSTDTANRVADFLYGRDDDILFLAGIAPSEQDYRAFAETRLGRLIQKGQWELAQDNKSWVPVDTDIEAGFGSISTNSENNDMDGFNYRPPENFSYIDAPLYDEITFIGLDGQEKIKVNTDSTKRNYPLSTQLRDVSKKENTYVKAEDYFEKLKSLKPGEIYVSDVIGAYVGSNYIGMYTPEYVSAAASDRGYDILYDPENQAYAGKENPNGRRFEGIVRWATPVTDNTGAVTGYVTFALNHDHIMEFVDHVTPMNERYTELPSAFEGNYAFIWDYKCRSICHPRHHSIVGYDPETGDQQIPWLESSIYEAWQSSGVQRWTDFVKDLPEFDNQSRSKKPAGELTKAGFVGLDGRYLNNAPQCTGWMDLTEGGGSGSFYILWSGLYKLTTAAAIPYYTGQYAPSGDNDFSRRGFGFVAIGAGLEDFTRPARETEQRLEIAIGENLADTSAKLIGTTVIIIILVVFIAIWMASYLTGNITHLIRGISRFRAGERQFRFNAPIKDEFGTLADSFDDMADSIVFSMKNPLAIMDMNRKIIYMNSYGLELCKKTLDEIVGTSYDNNSVYPQDSVYNPIAALEKGLDAEIYYYEDGDRYIKGVANYFLSKTGKKIGYIVETRDVTDMVREQIKTEQQRTLLNEIFSASPDLIWYKNADGEYLAVNPRFASVAGKSADEFIGKTGTDMLPPGIAESFVKNDNKAIDSARPIYTEEHIVFADGHAEILDSVRTPIYDASSGALYGLLGFARNVTARVEIENALRTTQLELEQAVNDANRANEHKGEFLARMSHEIRTPMNAIIGITSIVIKKLEAVGAAVPEAPEIAGHIRQIEASSQHLLGLLNDILDVSKIEAGKIELMEENVELIKLANTVTGIIKPRCDEKNIEFKTRVDSFDPSTFISDSLRLRQVLINLLGNAVKFTPECGTITFTVKKLERRDGKTLVEFSVADTGIGISREKLEIIFQPFEQGGGKISRNYGGTGLGLAISRSIVHLFGGNIEVKSTVGAGSEFSFSIWLLETESDTSGEAAISDVEGRFSGKRMLLVDDVDINRIIAIAMLEMTGIAIDEADDGISALEKFRESPAGAYDIILMDVQMPNMDGYEASMAIRALDRPDAQSVPIVALTANAFKEDIDKALQSGMNAHISKPVEVDTLLEVLVKFLC